MYFKIILNILLSIQSFADYKEALKSKGLLITQDAYELSNFHRIEILILS